MLLLVGGRLSLVHRSLKEGVSLQKIGFLTKFDRVRTIFESCDLLQTIGSLSIRSLSWEQNFVNL